MRFRRSLVRSWAVVVVVASLLGTAVALTAIFSHTFPPVTVTPAVITTTCASLTLGQTTVFSGTSGSIVALCGTGPGFTVTTVGSATPSFVLPSGYTDLAVFTHTGSMYCTPGIRGFIRLTAGTSVSFSTAGEAFDYCLSYNNPTADLSGFSVGWSQ